MKRLIGLVLLIVAIVGGAYIGGWLFFFKAIVDIVEAVKAGFLAKEIAIAVCKIVIGIPVVEVIAWVMGSFGIAMMVSGD